MLLAYPGRVLITTMFPEKLIDWNPVFTIILLTGIWFDTLLYNVSLGRTYAYFPLEDAAFATLSSFKSRLNVACVILKPSL